MQTRRSGGHSSSRTVPPGVHLARTGLVRQKLPSGIRTPTITRCMDHPEVVMRLLLSGTMIPAVIQTSGTG